MFLYLLYIILAGKELNCRLFPKQPPVSLFSKGIVVVFHKIIISPDYIFILNPGE